MTMSGCAVVAKGPPFHRGHSFKIPTSFSQIYFNLSSATSSVVVQARVEMRDELQLYIGGLGKFRLWTLPAFGDKTHDDNEIKWNCGDRRV